MIEGKTGPSHIDEILVQGARNEREIIMYRKPGPENHNPFSPLLPPETPGPLGRNDAGDPDAKSLLGNMPGPLGVDKGAGKIALFGWGSNSTQSTWVRPDLHGLKPLGQARSTLCWLTCFQMLYIWKRLDPTTIEAKLRTGGLDFDEASRRGLLPHHETLVAARALGLGTLAVGGGFSVADLKQYLAYSPLWVAGEWFQHALHARLVTGASDDWVEFFDPWYGGNAGGQADSYKHLASIFLHGDGNVARGMDKLAGKYQMCYWGP
jgi:hypothetical protein